MLTRGTQRDVVHLGGPIMPLSPNAGSLPLNTAVHMEPSQINLGDLTLYLTYDADQGAYHPVFQELREGLWLNRATRLVVLDFTFYNANINIFSIVKLAIEYLPVGGFLLNPQVTTVQVKIMECRGYFFHLQYLL
jgi:hypothetical protein